MGACERVLRRLDAPAHVSAVSQFDHTDMITPPITSKAPPSNTPRLGVWPKTNHEMIWAITKKNTT
jgi:hypothetical protein